VGLRLNPTKRARFLGDWLAGLQSDAAYISRTYLGNATSGALTPAGSGDLAVFISMER
jgi:hypothetical protein